MDSWGTNLYGESRDNYDRKTGIPPDVMFQSTLSKATLALHGGARSVKRAQRRVVDATDRRLSRYRLHRDYPFLRSYYGHGISERMGLREKHNEYTAEVSNQTAPVSLELSTFVVFLCENLKPRTVLDLGSGFSSYIFRRYEAEADTACTVYSVDDSADWLETTRRYLEKEGLSTDRLMVWDEFIGSPPASFDLVLHDIGKLAGRVESLPGVLRLVKPGGIIVLDDMQKPHFRAPVAELLRGHPWRQYRLEDYTLDELGRYAWMVRVSEPEPGRERARR